MKLFLATTAFVATILSLSVEGSSVAGQVEVALKIPNYSKMEHFGKFDYMESEWITDVSKEFDIKYTFWHERNFAHLNLLSGKYEIRGKGPDGNLTGYVTITRQAWGPIYAGKGSEYPTPKQRIPHATDQMYNGYEGKLEIFHEDRKVSQMFELSDKYKYIQGLNGTGMYDAESDTLTVEHAFNYELTPRVVHSKFHPSRRTDPNQI